MFELSQAFWAARGSFVRHQIPGQTRPRSGRETAPSGAVRRHRSGASGAHLGRAGDLSIQIGGNGAIPFHFLGDNHSQVVPLTAGQQLATPDPQLAAGGRLGIILGLHDVCKRTWASHLAHSVMPQHPGRTGLVLRSHGPNKRNRGHRCLRSCSVPDAGLRAVTNVTSLRFHSPHCEVSAITIPT